MPKRLFFVLSEVNASTVINHGMQILSKKTRKPSIGQKTFPKSLEVKKENAYFASETAKKMEKADCTIYYWHDDSQLRIVNLLFTRLNN